MTEDGSKILRTMRQQAWERAKGELEALLSTYWSETEKFDEMRAAVTEFVEKVEQNGLAE